MQRTDNIQSSEEVRFRSVQWGIWLPDGAFGHCGTMNRTGELNYDSQSGELEAKWIDDSLGRESGIIIDDVIIREILVDRRREPSHLFFTLDRIPRFWSDCVDADERDGENRRNRSNGGLDEDPFGLEGLLEILYDEDDLTGLFGLFEDMYGSVQRYRLPAMCRQHAT